MSNKTRKNKKYKLIILLMNGLANRVIQIISAMGFAERWNMDLYISLNYINDNDHVSKEKSLKDIQQLFPSLKLLDKNYDTDNFSKIIITRGPFLTVSPYAYLNIKNPKKDIILSGQLQNVKYFPKKYVKLHLEEPKDNIIKNIKNLFFIQLRFGDYTTFPFSLFSINLLNYYKKCIERLKNKYKNITFIIITNDIEKSKKYIKDNLSEELNDTNDTNHTKLIYENGSRLDSIYYMSKCDGGIIANSTFGWIGGYANEKKQKENIFLPDKWWKLSILTPIYILLNGNVRMNGDWFTPIKV